MFAASYFAFIMDTNLHLFFYLKSCICNMIETLLTSVFVCIFFRFFIIGVWHFYVSTYSRLTIEYFYIFVFPTSCIPIDVTLWIITLGACSNEKEIETGSYLEWKRMSVLSIDMIFVCFITNSGLVSYASDSIHTMSSCMVNMFVFGWCLSRLFE